MKKQLKDDKSKFGIKPEKIDLNPLLKSLIKNEPKVTNIFTLYDYIDRVTKDLVFVKPSSEGKTLSVFKVILDLEHRQLFGSDRINRDCVMK